MKYIYFLEYWIPFGRSYGDLVCVVAANDEECLDLVLKAQDDLTEEYNFLIPQRIKSAKRVAFENALNVPSEILTAHFQKENL